MSKAAPKRPITPEEREALEALLHVGMPSASFDKRFRRDVLSPAKDTGELSEKAVVQLWRLFIRYRRQTCCPNKAALLRIAETHAAPDFRKQRAAENAQARIDELKRKYQEAMQTPTLDPAP